MNTPSLKLHRIRAANLGRAEVVAHAMGLIIDRIYGDKDKQFISIGARQMGVRGNHEPRWTDAQFNEFANWKL